MTHAIHLLVAPMLNAQTEFAHAYPNIKAIHIQCVDLNVSLVTTVLVIKHVSKTNASIHVLVLVVRMQSVM
jgi:hypothetical protein